MNIRVIQYSSNVPAQISNEGMMHERMMYEGMMYEGVKGERVSGQGDVGSKVTHNFSARVYTHLYMMFPLSRAFILPHCPFSKASCRGQKSPKRLKVMSPAKSTWNIPCP